MGVTDPFPCKAPAAATPKVPALAREVRGDRRLGEREAGAEADVPGQLPFRSLCLGTVNEGDQLGLHGG